MSDTYIRGVGMTRFGRHADVLAPELAQQAIFAALTDAQMGLHEIQAIYCANVFGGMILGQVIVRDLGLKGIPVYNVENACASGATAVHLARHALRAHEYENVLVFGIEQLTQLGGGTIPLQRNDDKTELYAKAGMVLPAVYAMRGTRFLHEQRGTREDLAAVAVKNRFHGTLNEYAQQPGPSAGRRPGGGGCGQLAFVRGPGGAGVLRSLGRNLLAAEVAAGVSHHVALSVVGTDRLQESGYFRAKAAQEKLIKASPIPYTIVQATQFFEFVGSIAQAATEGQTVRLSPALFQPIASDDVAAAMADFAVGAPVGHGGSGRAAADSPHGRRAPIPEGQQRPARGDC